MKTLFALAIILLSGCASTQDKFYANKYALQDAFICQAYFARIAEPRTQLKTDLQLELERRKISPDMCRGIIDEQNDQRTIALAAVLANASNSFAVPNNQPVVQPVYRNYWQSEEIRGQFRYCKYRSGIIQVYSITDACPMYQ